MRKHSFCCYSPKLKKQYNYKCNEHQPSEQSMQLQQHRINNSHSGKKSYSWFIAYSLRSLSVPKKISDLIESHCYGMMPLIIP